MKPCTKVWLEEMAETFALMGALLNITHPEMYRAGREALKAIIEKPELVKEGEGAWDILRFWTTPFTGYGLISNCITPLHRDNNSQGTWYDFLTTVGEYQPGFKLKLENIDTELAYNSGTMVALLGKVVRHGTPEADGHRICIAQYMRDNVQERLGIPAPGWMTVDSPI